jgi:hypothetical protein
MVWRRPYTQYIRLCHSCARVDSAVRIVPTSVGRIWNSVTRAVLSQRFKLTVMTVDVIRCCKVRAIALHGGR